MFKKKYIRSTKWIIIFLALAGVMLVAADCQKTGPTEGPAQAKNTDPNDGNSSGFDAPAVESEDGPSGDTPGVLYSRWWPGLWENGDFEAVSQSNRGSHCAWP